MKNTRNRAGGGVSGAVCAAMLAGLAAGCGPREDIRVMDEPETSAPAAVSASASAAPPPMGASSVPPAVEYEIPEGWAEEASGRMRVANFSVDAPNGLRAEVAVIPLPASMGGSAVDVVNIWREELQLPEATEADLAALSSPVTVAGRPGVLYDLVSDRALYPGDEPGRIRVANVSSDGWNWFVKMSGPDTLVRDQGEAFITFLEQLRFRARPQPSAPAPMPGPAPGAGGRPEWTVPDGWTETSPGSMILARFDVGESAQVTVSAFPGDVGGVLANVNRWRARDLGLGPAVEADLAGIVSDVDAGGAPAQRVSMASDGKGLEVVLVSQGGRTWFYKLLGPEEIVTREWAKLIAFVRSVRYSDR